MQCSTVTLHGSCVLYNIQMLHTITLMFLCWAVPMITSKIYHELTRCYTLKGFVSVSHISVLTIIHLLIGWAVWTQYIWDKES